MVVVELSPGSGWYTEILANYIHQPGRLIAAHYDPQSQATITEEVELALKKVSKCRNV